MGYAVIMFVILVLMAVSIALSANYGVSKDSQEAPQVAENAYAEREGGKVQTDFVVEATKINGTAIYTSVESSPNLLNLHLIIRNNGSIILDPRKYSVILNRTWVPISSTSNNATLPLSNSSTSSLNLQVTPSVAPMGALSLLVTAENGVKIITPASPVIYYLDVLKNDSDPTCYRDANISWSPSYGEIWPIDRYTVYYTDDPNEVISKNNYEISFTTSSETNKYIGKAFKAPAQSCAGDPGNSSIYVWVSATDIHGNQGPPSNTCKAFGLGQGSVKCNYP